SLKLLGAVINRINENGYKFGNCDITIIAQKPKMKAYIPQMRQNIAEVLGCDIGCVSVKCDNRWRRGWSFCRL
ncbi:MAG: 2-C-methyl-D-erythritol 2,4-cyclodiphosphate synthase, partial [Clostridia bacterium]|nr:2-C-methyl-D-erythritol 2,4-cyclodiphosphate synthase [Clostridia bacterium]